MHAIAKPSEGIPAWFSDALAPLVRQHPGDFTADDARDYWDVLHVAPEKWLRLAVLTYRADAETPFMPAAGVLLKIARKLQREFIRLANAKAPPCEYCATDGLVWVPRPVGNRSDGYACICFRGEQRRRKGWPQFDPQTMTTEAAAKAKRLESEPETKRLSYEAAIDVVGQRPPKPASKHKLRRKYLRRLAVWEHERRSAAGALPAADESESGE